MIIIKNAMENYYIRTEILHASFIQNKEKILGFEFSEHWPCCVH